jgi:hypothetical protein
MGGGGGDSIGAALEEGGRAAPGGGMRGGAAIVWEGGRDEEKTENRRRRKKIEINELNSDIYPGTQVYCLTITGYPVLNSELLSFLFSKVILGATGCRRHARGRHGQGPLLVSAFSFIHHATRGKEPFGEKRPILATQGYKYAF